MWNICRTDPLHWELLVGHPLRTRTHHSLLRLIKPEPGTGGKKKGNCTAAIWTSLWRFHFHLSSIPPSAAFNYTARDTELNKHLEVNCTSLTPSFRRRGLLFIQSFLYIISLLWYHLSPFKTSYDLFHVVILHMELEFKLLWLQSSEHNSSSPLLCTMLIRANMSGM